MSFWRSDPPATPAPNLRESGASAGLSRRELLRGGGFGAAALALPGLPALARNLPLEAARFPAAGSPGAPPWAGYARSLREEHDYAAEVEGSLPEALRGTLYRNGPGLFERGGLRKRCILDGDGMMQSFRLEGGRARYRNRFVRTDKFREEEGQQAWRYSTWCTQAPGGLLSNIWEPPANQAGVSTVLKNGRLYAFDESSRPHELDPETLETRGLVDLGAPEDRVYSAHSKTDALSGEWLHHGLAYGRGVDVHLTRFGADGALKESRVLPLPRYAYMHDWFVTPRHYVFNVHPAEMSIFRFLSGVSSLVGCIDWRPEQGNLIWVVPRDPAAEPFAIETEPCWMWHTLNAWERDGEIVADFVGYDAPDHFIGRDPRLFAVMEGRRGEIGAFGTLRRYVIDLRKRTVRAEELAGGGTHEFPIANPRHACHRHRFSYSARGNGRGGLLWHQLVRTDTDSGATQVHDFGEDVICCEPIFAPEPGRDYAPGGEEPGWLLAQCFDTSRGRSFLAVLRADRLADGPVAKVHQRHHVPLSLHGWWQAAA